MKHQNNLLAHKHLLMIVFLLSVLINSCSKKNHPTRTPEKSDEAATKSNDSVIVKKPVFKPTRKDIIPKVIVVNDSAARKSVDGRLYYDLLRNRYWKNYKDGKYYLFNKSMYTNDAFKKPR